MNIPYTFYNQMVVRNPYFPFQYSIPENIIEQLLHNEFFLEAIYLASPILYDEVIKLKEGKINDAKSINKIHNSLVKYYQRMYSRCTPFGLFSGCSTVQWEDITQIKNIETDLYRSTRLDMHYLCALAQRIALIPAIKERLIYFSNTSVYLLNDEVRYVEYKYKDNRREHQISAVLKSDYLLQALDESRNGATIEKLIQVLIEKNEVTVEEAKVFIDELIESQLLVNELEPAITGGEFLQQILKTLQRINSDKNDEITEIIDILQSIEKEIEIIDKSFENDISSYRKLIEKIKQLKITVEENKLFQTDLFRKSNDNKISTKFKQSLVKAFSFLNGLNSNYKNQRLSDFVKKFNERYEGKQMPLLQLIDTESGIKYSNYAGNYNSPLLENLILPDNTEESSFEWSKTQDWLFKKLLQAFKDDTFEVQIQEEDIQMFEPNWSDLPPSVAAMFTLVDEDKIILENFSGSSAINLLGRFAHGNNEINNLINNIVIEEDAINNDVIFAEIIHLPQDRLGNILLHPSFRKYEIPFLAKSSVTQNFQIALSDLYVTVNGEKITLFSKILQKQIIPKLSTAHNFSNKTLPIYQFLCDLQTHQLRSYFAFNWGSMAKKFTFLPRVVLDDVILLEATWYFYKKDIEILCSNEKNALFDFIKKWKIPHCIVLADGDNELLVDFQNQISVKAFIDTIKSREFITVKEFLSPVSKNKEDVYVNQFIAPLIKTEKFYNSSTINFDDDTIKDFSPGSEWLYYKLYCGIKSADKILLECIKPVVGALLKENIIDKWFFIRYSDPDFHLRLRVHLIDKEKIGYVMGLFSNALHKFDEENIIWKTQLDTYQREINRYTSQAIELGEKLFFRDSMMKLSFLQTAEGDKREGFRWLFGLKSVDTLLNAFQFSLHQKCALLKKVKEIFAKEFSADKHTFKQLNQKYASNKSKIEYWLSNFRGEDAVINSFFDLFDKENNGLINIADKIISLVDKQTLENLMYSYIHMSLNRLFVSEARLQEMIAYDFLYKYYNSLLIRQNNKIN